MWKRWKLDANGETNSKKLTVLYVEEREMNFLSVFSEDVA